MIVMTLAATVSVRVLMTGTIVIATMVAVAMAMLKSLRTFRYGHGCVQDGDGHAVMIMMFGAFCDEVDGNVLRRAYRCGEGA